MADKYFPFLGKTAHGTDGSTKRKRRNSASESKPIPDGSPSRDAMEITIDGVVIKGYHKFKRRPPMGLRMSVVPEPDNPYDPNALTVEMPGLEDLPAQVRNVVTDPKRGTTVKSLAGKCIGRLPGSLASVLSHMSSEIELEGMTCVAKGPPCPSFFPWPLMHQKGGGAVIPCELHVRATHNKERAMAKLQEGFGDMGPEKAVLTLH
ncbi:uncharacterized protein [Branchiostoma lanceolatum]